MIDFSCTPAWFGGAIYLLCQKKLFLTRLKSCQICYALDTKYITYVPSDHSIFTDFSFLSVTDLTGNMLPAVFSLANLDVRLYRVA